MQRHGTAVHCCNISLCCHCFPRLAHDVGSAQARLLASCTLYLHAQGMTVSVLCMQSHVSGITDYSWEATTGNQTAESDFWVASLQVYKILLNATACVQPVSCDEAYLDVTGLGDPEEVAASIRQQIFEATGCTASAGIGPSMLVARLATKKGKPNGQFRIETSQVRLFTKATEGLFAYCGGVESHAAYCVSGSCSRTKHTQPSQAQHSLSPDCL